MPLFIDRLPFHVWVDTTRTPHLSYWSIRLPVIVADPGLTAPTSTVLTQDWVLDTGNSGEALAWRHHLVVAGLDPHRHSLPQPVRIHTAAGIVTLPRRKVDLWLLSNLATPPEPFRIPLYRRLPFRDTPALPDPHFQRPLIGIRALRTAGLRVEIDFAHDTVSVWTPDPKGP